MLVQFNLTKKEVVMKDLTLLGLVAVIILIIGGINWGLVGLFNVNLVQSIFGNMLSRLIYIIVGVAAGYMIYLFYLAKIKKII
jgi:uncharacterized protein